ncbi:DNA-binding response regulator, OmpR family, contains REC and winged-helix (wHTH) domain [Prosthecobacter debontii]|uniref:DNA-binding response regulator, OmpR family, contains REC and winged-helix (WHTH) domain n=1 Tax=Prosthecobacter debontii TaxID=48467 RepID=A0A1T4X9B0_9BACT|nr:response regulator transcription factor [Prosthecobacter debontii]SKA85481.1 DNA-binding response regulator, OmpR family, contains REC and winged-helix (wHTH) domain [Prosthecobacter debontii]
MKILIAEDDNNTREALREVLSMEGYDTVTASDGLQAVDFFRATRPDFVCLDVMMPGQNGYEVCKQIRKMDENVPILFITAKAEEIDTVLGLELGADDYMTKPFGVKEIIARIRAIMRRTAARSTGKQVTEEFTMDDLRIVPSELRAYRDGIEIQLSPRDVKVLTLLYSRRGKVVDRNTMADEVWGVDYFPESRALDQHVSQLRKRVEADPANPKIIRTVHGAGYRFE